MSTRVKITLTSTDQQQRKKLNRQKQIYNKSTQLQHHLW